MSKGSILVIDDESEIREGLELLLTGEGNGVSSAETGESGLAKSEEMLTLLDLVTQVAPSRSTVLISGESGTGKELIAKAIHSASTRADKTFVPVNTGSIPVDLLESQLFGHVRGAFTSAVASK